MKNILTKGKNIIWKLSLWFLIISLSSVIILKLIPVLVTPLMLIRCVEQKIDGKSMKLDKQWKPIEDISTHLQLAVVCTEDQNFLKHRGFDFDAINKLQNATSKSIGRLKRGQGPVVTPGLPGVW